MNFITYPLHNPMSKLAVAVIAVSMSSFAMAGSIQNIGVNQVDSTVELQIDFDAQAVEPTAYYQLENPSRLVLDFQNIASQLASKIQPVNQGNVTEVTALSNATTTRLVVGLNKTGQYSTRKEGNRLVLSIQNPIDAPVISTPAPVETVGNNKNNKVAQPETMVVKVNPLLNPSNNKKRYNYDGITTINHQASSSGGNNVVINLTNESIPLDVQRSGDELVVRMTGATVPKNLLRQLNVGNGLIKSIITNNQGRNGVIRISMKSDYEYKAYQTGTQLNISIDPPKRLRQPTLEERTYSGAPLSMEFQDVGIRNVLELLGQHTNTNIVASDSVSGNITLRLINVPWDQALDIILKSKNLDKRSNGNVIWIAPAEELQTQETKELEAQQKAKDLAPLRTEYIRLNYAKATDMRTLIEAGRSSTENQNTGSLLSQRGTVTIDERTNTLIIKDTSESITNIRDLINKLDIPVKQVMIEARIVSAKDNFSKELGVKWGILSQGAASNRNLLVGGSDQTLWDLKKFSMSSTTVNGQSVSHPTYTITRPDNLNVDLGVANSTGKIAFGLLTMSDLLLDLELSAMQADNKGEIISSPKVLTADKQTAKVMSGTQIAYQEASASGATATNFVEAALSLEVTPNITPEGRIGMNLKIENGTPTIINGSTAISKDAITTNVVVDDGQTVVLGGVFKNNITNNVSKVPFLGDLPYINRLFRKTVKNNNKEELLIFVTPKLVHDTANRIN